jgi:hypothetical protein
MIGSAIIVFLFAGLVWYAVLVRSEPPPPPESGKALIQKLESGK